MNDIALGVAHITDWQGYDHMLYLLALVARYDLRHGQGGLWRRPSLWGTASRWRLRRSMCFVSGAWVEFLIPVTILGTALWGCSTEKRMPKAAAAHIMAASFGLIHGLGFSSFSG